MSNSDVVRAFIGHWEARNIDAIIDAFTDDPFYHNMPMEPLTSKDAIRAFIAPFLEPVTAVRWDVLFIAEDANGNVLTERVDAFEFGDKTIALPVMGTFELVDGKISKWRDYFDLGEFERQMASLQG